MEDAIIAWAIQGGTALRNLYPSNVPGVILVAIPLFLVGVWSIASKR